ncbi:MAG TPA: hypothetical protein GX401_09870 [Clostridiales bacterium]|nr:hypothetical protein [Clostridiales bacterium]
MSNFDDIFNTPAQAPAKQENDKPFDKESWKEKKQLEREQAYTLIDTTAEDISTDSEKFQTYLDVQSHFDRYSVGNALLITAQMPQATQFKDFDAWKENGVSIKKQQKGVTILEPGEEYTREDGSVGVSYNVKKVFDISQTTSKDKAKPAVHHDERLLLKALINNSPAAIKISEALPESVGALYQPETNEIAVRKGMDAPDIFRCVSQELAHAQFAAQGENYSRSEAGFKAYCASYMLCKKNGIDVSGYDFKNLPDNIREADAQSIRSELSSVREAVNDISARMAKVLEVSKAPRQQGQER